MPNKQGHRGRGLGDHPSVCCTCQSRPGKPCPSARGFSRRMPRSHCSQLTSRALGVREAADALAASVMGDVAQGGVLQVAAAVGGESMAVWRGQRVVDFGLALMSRRFPPPWSVEETDACFIVKDHAGLSLASVYFEEEPGRGRLPNCIGSRLVSGRAPS
jgi:hypothetical protein